VDDAVIASVEYLPWQINVGLIIECRYGVVGGILGL